MFKSIKRRLSVNSNDKGKTLDTPTSDVALPEKRDNRRRASTMTSKTIQTFRSLALLKDTPAPKREQLFKQKLELCNVIFEFTEKPMRDKHDIKLGKELKRATLMELVEWVNTSGGQKIFTESTMQAIVDMFKSNIIRDLPPRLTDYDPEEDEPVLEPAWPHLQVVYEFLLRFIISPEVNSRTCKKFIDQEFCIGIIELFDSEDPRERDYLKTILHRIYGKFMSHRGFIRKYMQHVFYQFVFETERHNGVGELLEILGSIINGFALPLKKEHLSFLERALLPLHKPKCIALYQQQLTYCVTQYVEKDSNTSTTVIGGILKFWPWSSSTKQVLFINELEEVLELVSSDQLEKIAKSLFSCVSRCLNSSHFQVAERTLFLWNNEHLYTIGCMGKAYNRLVLPELYGALYSNSQGHWNSTVENLSQSVLKTYMDYDLAFYDEIARKHEIKLSDKMHKMEDRSQQFEVLDKLIHANNC